MLIPSINSPTVSALPRFQITRCSPLAQPGVRVAVVAHIFYPDLIPEIYTTLRHIVEPFDLIVTTPHEDAVADISVTFSLLAAGMAVVVSENRGRDVGPFIAVHRNRMLDHYDAVLKLHSKKSLYDSSRGTAWRQNMYRQLCGNSKITRRSIALLRDGLVGMIGPRGYHIGSSDDWYWGSNRNTVHRLLQSLSAKPLRDDSLGLSFFAGTMFWFTPKALLGLHKIPDTLLEFEPENGQLDGTLAHALERVFGMLPAMTGYRLASLASAGLEFDVIHHAAAAEIGQ